jgi:hypothetical protein
MEMRDLVLVDRHGERAADAISGITCAVLAQTLDQVRIILGGARLEALDRIPIFGAGGGGEDSGAGIGCSARIAPVDQQRFHPGAHQVVGGRGADHAAADHDRIEGRHERGSGVDGGTVTGCRAARARRD